MGVHIYNKEFDMNMGYGSFLSLRTVIAKLLDTDFGDNYEKLRYCYNQEQYDENDVIANTIINEKNLDEDILDFLYTPDCEGKITYKVCKKLYNLIKDYDDEFRYGYIHSNNTFSYFKDMIHDCACKRRNLYWS